MEWTPEAREAFKQVPPAVQTMARKGIEAYARDKGLGTVNIEVLEEARSALMGGSRSGADRVSGLNVGVNRRHTMHLTDMRHFFANETEDPLHDAFDYKMTVHAMPKGEPVKHETLQKSWNKIMDNEKGLPLRTLYIHIPFCETHCRFCGFYQNPYRSDLAEKYVSALIQEMELTAKEPFVRYRPFQSVYFGGGTPTALSSTSLARLVSTVNNLFPLSSDCEITLEGRTYNFTHEKIEAAVTSGINRISLGVQSFDTKIRKSLGRKETKEKVIETLGYLKNSGQAAVIIDLIYGLPGQSLEIWKNDIKTFLSLEIDGCDLYQLNIFRGGPLEKAVEKDFLPKPATLKEQADYYALGVELMEAAHYRRLSMPHWARTTRERSLYNLFSMGRSECVPLGSGAGGWIRDYFFFVEGDLNVYFKTIEAGQKPFSFGMKRPKKDLLYRDISYQMELGYCDLKEISSLYHLDLLNVLQPVLSQWENVGLIDSSDGCIYLTRAGEFWTVNLAQILIDFLQKKLG
jgi:Coproporphyrinogen III oxidase and related Fe-S oxidoreductases